MKKRLGLLAIVLLALGVTACNTGVDGAVAKLQQAYDSLGALVPDPSNITTGFEVPVTLANSVTAEWSSDEPGVISFGTPANGFSVATVNRPAKDAGDATVSISALLSLQSELTSEMLHQTWTIDLTVKQNTVADLAIDNIEDILAITEKAYDATLTVTLNDMTIFAKSAGEAFAYDGTGIIQVYAGAVSNMSVGKVYTISGTADWYFGIWEITKSTATEQTSATPNYPTKEQITSVQAKITELTTANEHLSALGDASDGNFEPIYARITGKIYMIPSDTSNYNTWIMDTEAAAYAAGIAKTATVAETPSNSLMVYYNTSDFTLVKQFNGLVVTMDVVIYTYRSNNHAFAVYYVGGPAGIDATLTDAQKQSIDANTLSLPSSVTEATTLNLPTLGNYGSTIVWTSNNETVINPTNGAVTIPEVGVRVTMTASVTIGSLTAVVKTFTVVVGPLPNTSLATMLTGAKNDVLYSEAEVLWLKSDAKAAIVGDSTGYGYIYSSTALTIEVGKFYGFNYTIDVYNGLFEMTKVTVLTARGTDPNLTVTPTTWTATEALALSATAWSPVYVAMQLVGYTDGDYVNGYLAGFGSGYVQVNGSTAALAGKKFTATGWIIGRSSGAVPNKITIQGTYTNAVDATDAEKLAVSVGLFKAPAANAALTANLTLPTSKFGTVAWTSSNTAVLSDAGVVTRPAIGQPDAAVTLSYVITVGSVSTEAVVINFTVIAQPDPNAPVTVTAAYAGSTTNMAASPANNAALIGLDAGLFTVVSIKGDGSVEIGLNTAGQIRLYANRTTGNGNTLSVAIGSGYVITSVVFTFGASSNSPTGNLVLGSTATAMAAADLTSVTKTYSALSINSFTLQNTQNSGTSNAQIYIMSIAITYQPVVA